MKKATLAAVLSIALAACGTEGTPGAGATRSSAPTVSVQTDLSTPDKAIKSYWSTVDAVRVAEHAFSADKRPEYEALNAPLMDLFTADVRASMDRGMDEPDTFSRDIISIDVETESRAVVVARIRNTSPIPQGAELTRYDEDARRNGDQYKYVLEQDDEEWRVAEIWEQRSYPEQHWEKLLPADPKPSVPTFTYEAR